MKRESGEDMTKTKEAKPMKVKNKKGFFVASCEKGMEALLLYVDSNPILHNLQIYPRVRQPDCLSAIPRRPEYLW